jgi:hypothetical protein
MAKGIDIAGDVRPHLDKLKAAGVEFIFRYYARHTHIPGKILTLDEAQAISAAGFKLGAVYENGFPTTAEYFTSEQGKADAASALNQALMIGQPAETPIYFAVDCDLSYDAISTRLFNYFVGIRNTWDVPGHPRLPYAVGVYGSGLVCEKMTDWVLANYSWLAGAKGWQGYEAFLPRATIVQAPFPESFPRDLHDFPYSDSDWDTTSTEDYGGFQVPVAPTA